jgi:hypothetical protein
LGQGSKEVAISRRELLLKSLVYRAYTTIVELCLASLLKLLANIDVVAWVLLINALKLFAYFGFDMGWFSFLRRPGILPRLKRRLKVEAA